MSQPLRIACGGISDIPALEVLDRLATRQQHVVLDFRVSGGSASHAFDIGSIIARLAPLLPEDIVVFDAGSSTDARSISIMRVLGKETILHHAETIHAAAADFKELASRLVSELSTRLELSPDRLAKDPLIRLKLGDRDSGSLNRLWDYVFHGLECRFQNRETGQVVEVQLAFEGEFGALGPQFFHTFLSTTPRFAPLTAIFEDPYHDVRRALEILAEGGLLRRVLSTFSGGESFVAP